MDSVMVDLRLVHELGPREAILLALFRRELGGEEWLAYSLDQWCELLGSGRAATRALVARLVERGCIMRQDKAGEVPRYRLGGVPSTGQSAATVTWSPVSPMVFTGSTVNTGVGGEHHMYP